MKVVLQTHVEASWPPQGHCVKSRPKVHKQVLVNLMQVHEIGTQDKHLFLTPNK